MRQLYVYWLYSSLNLGVVGCGCGAQWGVINYMLVSLGDLAWSTRQPRARTFAIDRSCILYMLKAQHTAFGWWDRERERDTRQFDCPPVMSCRVALGRPAKWILARLHILCVSCVSCMSCLSCERASDKRARAGWSGVWVRCYVIFIEVIGQRDAWMGWNAQGTPS